MNLQPVDRARQLAGVTAYALRKAIREGKIQVLKGYWSTAQLSEVTGLRANTIRKMAQEGVLPHEPVGGAYYFNKETILTDIAQRMAQDSQSE